MKILIKNGHIIDPANNVDEVRDILVENGKIIKVAKMIKEAAEKTIDASAKLVLPGIVDMHVHLREPGREDKETILTGTKAAAKGGVTSVLAMPNTEPAIDSPEAISLLKAAIAKTNLANVFICAAITKGRMGKELTNILKLKKQGAIAISDDGASVDNRALFLKALKIAKEKKVLVISHCEDKSLSGSGVINLGIMSTRLGLRGISKESEYKRVERDIQLADKVGARLHIAHVSCKESVEIIAKAKKRGLNISAETAPHYFCFIDEDIFGFNTNLKVNPPLRSKDDSLAIKQGLKSGVIDVIASDHAPHTQNEKDIEFDRAEFGAIGLETELSASISQLLEAGLLDWKELVRKLSLNPARILGLDKGTLGVGRDADIVIISADKEWVIKKESIASKSTNSPFIGKKLKGLVEHTICNGEVVYKHE